MATVTVGGNSYHIDDRLKARWDRLKDGKLAKLDEDRIYVVDGRERSGKSLFTLQQAAYIDPSILDPEEAKKRITFDPEHGLASIRDTQSSPKETKVLIFDEAFRGLSSRAALSKTNKKIIKDLIEMGQKNLVLFIVLPSFFMLDLYPAMIRSNALLHINKSRGSRKRAFHVYNYSKKATLYQIGIKKGWKYHIGTQFKGRFYGKYPGGDEFEKLYRKMKKDALESMDKVSDKQDELNKYQDELYKIYQHKYKELENFSAVARWISDAGIKRTSESVRQIVRNNTEKPEKSQEQG